jgi:hypothetical protein
MKAKHILTVILCTVCLHTGFAQNNDKLFEKYTNIEDVTTVYISKAMFQMIPVMEMAGLNLVNMKGKIESLQILSTKRQDLIPQMRKEFSNLVDKHHTELMRVKDTNTNATFYADMHNDTVKNLVMLADADSSFIVIQLLGNFTLQDMQEITKDMEK